MPLPAPAMVALIRVGCSNAPAENGNAGNTNAANHEKAVKFAESMRENGVREFADPDASGTFAYGIEKGSSLGGNERQILESAEALRFAPARPAYGV